jgi:hypothetical protein
MKLKTNKTYIKRSMKESEIKSRRTKLKSIIYDKLELRIKLKINKIFTKGLRKKIKNQNNRDQIEKNKI